MKNMETPKPKKRLKKTPLIAAAGLASAAGLYTLTGENPKKPEEPRASIERVTEKKSSELPRLTSNINTKIAEVTVGKADRQERDEGIDDELAQEELRDRVWSSLQKEGWILTDYDENDKELSSEEFIRKYGLGTRIFYDASKVQKAGDWDWCGGKCIKVSRHITPERTISFANVNLDIVHGTVALEITPFHIVGRDFYITGVKPEEVGSLLRDISPLIEQYRDTIIWSKHTTERIDAEFQERVTARLAKYGTAF